MKENEWKNKPENEHKTKKFKKEYKKQKNNNKMKIWVCLGRSEVYKESIVEVEFKYENCYNTGLAKAKGIKFVLSTKKHLI